jgi:hypothetical protein
MNRLCNARQRREIRIRNTTLLCPAEAGCGGSVTNPGNLTCALLVRKRATCAWQVRGISEGEGEDETVKSRLRAQSVFNKTTTFRCLLPAFSLLHSARSPYLLSTAIMSDFGSSQEEEALRATIICMYQRGHLPTDITNAMTSPRPRSLRS